MGAIQAEVWMERLAKGRRGPSPQLLRTQALGKRTGTWHTSEELGGELGHTSQVLG